MALTTLPCATALACDNHYFDSDFDDKLRVTWIYENYFEIEIFFVYMSIMRLCLLLTRC
jgi:hypothetical protein